MNSYWSPYPRRPVPKIAVGGIKIHRGSGSISKTWWGQQWIRALESFGWHTRLERGKRYARIGQVLSIKIEPGLVWAQVQGSRLKPYLVKIAMHAFSVKEWSRAADELSRKAIYSAQLLAGEMPLGIEEPFRLANLSLFPKSQSDLATDCSCPDWENPCKHIAAAYYVLAQEFDQDPFLLFKLRGLDRKKLLAAVGARRNIKSISRNPDEPRYNAIETYSVKPRKALKPINILKQIDTFYQLRNKLPGNVAELFSFTHQELPMPGGKIKEMGTPPFWRGETPFQETMTYIYEAVQNQALNSLFHRNIQ